MDVLPAIWLDNSQNFNQQIAWILPVRIPELAGLKKQSRGHKKNCNNMKSVPVPRHPFLVLASKMATAMLPLMLVFGTSCQKEPEITLPERQVAQEQIVMRSSADLEQQVVLHMQWLLDHVVPLLADEAVAAALQTGNTSADAVTARLQELGFASFEAFVQAFNNSGSVVQSALGSGNLTQEQLLEIVGSHTFTYSAMGGTGGFPCTDQLAFDLAQTPLVVALASGGSPLSSAIAGVVHVAISYASYKRCLRSTYPGTP